MLFLSLKCLRTKLKNISKSTFSITVEATSQEPWLGALPVLLEYFTFAMEIVGGGGGWSSVVMRLPSMCEALYLTPNFKVMGVFAEQMASCLETHLDNSTFSKMLELIFQWRCLITTFNKYRRLSG